MTQAAGGTRSAVLAMWVALFAVRVSGFGSPASSGEFCTDWNLAGGLHQSRGKPWPARYNARPDPIRVCSTMRDLTLYVYAPALRRALKKTPREQIEPCF